MRCFEEMQPVRKRASWQCRSAFAAFMLCALLTVCGLLEAQTGGTGALSGAVTDSTGAMVAGAHVRVTNVATGELRTAKTNDHGFYAVPLLPPGQYAIEITRQGFKAASSSDVKVTVAETKVLNIQLEPGAVTETVTVASSNVQLETASSELGRVTDSQMIENLPLVTRNYTQIIGLNPGVAQEANNAGNLGRGGGSLAALPGGGSIMSQGATSTDNNFEMNGLTVNDMQSSMFYSAGIPVPNPDTIQEFKVQTAQYDATTGRNAGADVDLITRTGTNDYHAMVFEYFRNEDLNANDWFAKYNGQPRQILRQNQYGFTASGPLIRKKVLLFGSWQGTKQLNALDPSGHKEVLLPPITDDRSPTGLGAVFQGQNGYLGAALGVIQPDGTVRTAWGSTAPIAAQAVNLLNVKLPDGKYMIPTPQIVNASLAANPATFDIAGSYFISQPGTFDENQWMANADYLRSDRNKIGFRYFGVTSLMDQPLLYSTAGNPLFIPERFDVGSVSETFTVRPNMVNQLVVGLHRSVFNMYYKNAFTFSSIGMNVPQEEDAYPNILIASDGFQTGTTSATAFGEDEYNIADALSWTKGKHQFTFGGAFAYGRDDMSKFFFETYVVPLSWADLLIGQSYSSIGVPYSNIYETLQGLGNFARDWRYKEGDVYVQDDFRVTPHLTLNIGVRWEHIGDLGVANGLGGNVDLAHVNPDPPAGGSLDGYLVASNYKGPTPLPAGVEQGKNTFGFNGQGQNVWNPRLGFAWVLPGTQRFVLRGGAGTYHTTTEGQMNLQMCASAPFGQWSFTEGPNNAAATDANPAPNPGAFPRWIPYQGASSSNFDTEFTMAAFALDFRPPTTYHYSLGLESRLPGGPILDVTYAGARDLHLIMGDSMNQADLASPSHPIRGQTTTTVANLDLRKPYQGWATGTMWQWRTGNEAWYSALQASLAQQWKHNLQYQASYTWARLLSPIPAFSTGTNTTGPVGDQNNLRAGYGPDANIRPQRFVLSMVYSLPGPSHSHRVLASAIGGWTISTTTLVQNGHQMSILYTNGNNAYGITGVGGDRASYAPGCTAKNLPTSGSVEYRALHGYINAACLAPPAVIGDDHKATGFGNTASGILRGPDQVNSDISLAKSFPARWPKEGASVQFRTDFFNAFNHPSFASPDLVYGQAAFGQITAMSDNPRVVQFSLKLAF